MSSDTHTAYGAAHLRYLSKPGRSYLMTAECLWCHKILQHDDAVLPGPERKQTAQVRLWLRHWSECGDGFGWIRWHRADAGFGSCPFTCDACWGLNMSFRLVESGSGAAVVEIVGGKRSRVRQIARRRDGRRPL